MYRILSEQKEEQEQALLGLLDKSDDSWVYHFPCWRRYLARTGQKDLSFVLLDKQENITCFFSLFSLLKNNFFCMRQLLSDGYVFPPHFSAKKRAQLLTQALEVVDSLAAQYHVDELEVRLPVLAQSNLPPLRKEINPLLWHYPFSPRRVANLTQYPTLFARIIDLAQDLGDIWHSFSYTCQKQLKKSERGGLKIHHGSYSDCEQIYHIMKTTYHCTNQPFMDRGVFQDVLRDLLSQGVVKIFLASFKNDLVGVLLNSVYRKEAEPWLAGSIKDFNYLAPNNFLQWQAIQYFKKAGFRWYLVGPIYPYLKDMGIRYQKMYHIGRFKNTFGGRLLPLYEGVKTYSPKKRLTLDFKDDIEMRARALLRKIVKRNTSNQ